MKSTLTPVDRIPSIHRSGRRVAVTGGDRRWPDGGTRVRVSVETLSGLRWEAAWPSDAGVRRATEELHAELRAERDGDAWRRVSGGRRSGVTCGGDTPGGEPRVSGTRGGHHVAARSTADGGLVTA